MHDILIFDRNREEEKQKMNEEMANFKTKVQVSLCSVFYYHMPLKQNFTFCSICVCSMQVVTFCTRREPESNTILVSDCAGWKERHGFENWRFKSRDQTNGSRTKGSTEVPQVMAKYSWFHLILYFSSHTKCFSCKFVTVMLATVSKWRACE